MNHDSQFLILRNRLSTSFWFPRCSVLSTANSSHLGSFSEKLGRKDGRTDDRADADGGREKTTVVSDMRVVRSRFKYTFTQAESKERTRKFF